MTRAALRSSPALEGLLIRLCNSWCYGSRGIPGGLMLRLLVSQVSLLRPTAGFLPGMRCPPNLAPPANWGDLTQGPGAAAARSWLHGHSSPRASTAAMPSATPQWRLQLNLRAASGDQLTRGVNWSDQPTNRNWLVGASTLQPSPSIGTSGGPLSGQCESCPALVDHWSHPHGKWACEDHP